ASTTLFNENSASRNQIQGVRLDIGPDVPFLITDGTPALRTDCATTIEPARYSPAPAGGRGWLRPARAVPYRCAARHRTFQTWGEIAKHPRRSGSHPRARSARLPRSS